MKVLAIPQCKPSCLECVYCLGPVKQKSTEKSNKTKIKWQKHFFLLLSCLVIQFKAPWIDTWTLLVGDKGTSMQAY